MEEIKLLNEFINGESRNQWLNSKRLNVYVRKALRYINKIEIRGTTPIKTLDIANISVNEGYVGKGLGMQFLKEAHEANPFNVTFIENVLNPSFEEKLRKDGWIEIEDTKCFYKRK